MAEEQTKTVDGVQVSGDLTGLEDVDRNDVIATIEAEQKKYLATGEKFVRDVQEDAKVAVDRAVAADVEGEKPAETPADGTEEKPAEDKPKVEGPAATEAAEETKLQQLRRSVTQRELALVEERKAWRAEQAHVRQEAASAVQRAEQVTQQAQEVLEYARNQPLAFLERYFGMTLEDLAQRAINGNQPTPQELARQTRAEVERLRHEAQQGTQRATEWQRQQAKAREEARFVAELGESPDMKEVLASFESEEDLLEEAYHVGRRLQRRGTRPTNAAIAREMQARYARRNGTDQANGVPAAKASATQVATKAHANGSGSQGSRAETTETGPTLTNKAQAARVSAPVDLLDLSEEDERRHVLAAAEKAMRDAQAR